MELDEKHRMQKNWRGRRFLMCRAIQDIHDLIENLDVEEGPDPHPEDFKSAVNDQLKVELQNQAAVLLRMFLILNDGGVSPQTLRRF